MNRKVVVNGTKFTIAVVTILCFVMYVFLINDVPNTSLQSHIYTTSIIGWVLWAFCIISWHRVTGAYFDLYTVFLSFIVLFNYGQCLMWAIGIHKANEIGRGLSFGVFVSDRSIYLGQLVTLMGILAFHCGAACSYKITDCRTYLERRNYTVDFNSLLRNITTITLIVSTICMLINSVRNVYITRMFGYGANLYNLNVVSTQNNIVILLSWLFFPSILAQLITTGYQRRVMIGCYILFTIDCILEFMAGDRGWVYWLAILIWMHHRYYKRLKAKQMFFYGAILLVVLLVAEGLSLSRGSGVSLEAAVDAIKHEDNPIASIFFELGSSMKPVVIIIEKSAEYPFGNTYIYSVIGMITDRVIKYFLPDYISVGSWFSQQFLRIPYGADFSIVAESFINYGFYFGIAFMAFLGWIISKAISLNQESSSTMKVFFASAVCSSILPMVRGTSTSALKVLMFSTLSIYLLCLLMSNFNKRSTYRLKGRGV